MGWKENTGLGKNEDGIVSAIKLKKNDETVGLGSEKDDGNGGWSKTSSSYNDVLKMLKETYAKPELKKKSSSKNQMIKVGIK